MVRFRFKFLSPLILFGFFNDDLIMQDKSKFVNFFLQVIYKINSITNLFYWFKLEYGFDNIYKIFHSCYTIYWQNIKNDLY